MTDFKVTDEAVEAAAKGIASVMGVPYQQLEHHARAAIDAMLPVMFERVGFTNTEELNELIAVRGGWVSGLELDGDTVTIYRLKEPK